MADGIKGSLDLSREEAMAIAALATAGIYNAVEIYVLVFSTFRQRRGRYFWSLIVADTGVFVHAIASLARFLRRSGTVVPGAFALAAWCAMVTGQSVVLWSRLHLVLYDRGLVRLVLALIATNGCAIHIPMAVLWVLCWATPEQVQHGWIGRYGIYEKVSILVFTLQETLLTGIFAYQGFYNLKPILAFKTRSAKTISWYLLCLFVIVFLLDVGLVILEYTNDFVFQTTSKALVYSIKLKVEFAVLNKLLAFTKMNSCDCHPSDGPGSFTKGVVTSDTNTTTKGLGAGGAGKQSGTGPSTIPEVERPDRIFDGQ